MAPCSSASPTTRSQFDGGRMNPPSVAGYQSEASHRRVRSCAIPLQRTECSVSIDTEEEMERVRRAGMVVDHAVRGMRDAVREGISTTALDELAACVLQENGARSAQNLVYG